MKAQASTAMAGYQPRPPHRPAYRGIQVCPLGHLSSKVILLWNRELLSWLLCCIAECFGPFFLYPAP